VYVRSSCVFFLNLFSDFFSVQLFQYLNAEFYHIGFCEWRRR